MPATAHIQNSFDFRQTSKKPYNRDKIGKAVDLVVAKEQHHEIHEEVKIEMATAAFVTTFHES